MVNVIVVVEIFYLLNCRSPDTLGARLGLFSNPWMLFGAAAMLAAQFLFTYPPFMNHLFHTAPLPAEAWLHIFAVGVFTFAVVEFEKWLRFAPTARCSPHAYDRSRRLRHEALRPRIWVFGAMESQFAADGSGGKRRSNL